MKVGICATGLVRSALRIVCRVFWIWYGRLLHGPMSLPKLTHWDGYAFRT